MNFNVYEKDENSFENLNSNTNFDSKMQKYEEYNETNREVLKLLGEIDYLKDLSNDVNGHPNVDDEIIKEANLQIQQLEKDLTELKDSTIMLQRLILMEDDDLDEVEELIFDADDEVDNANINFENSSKLINYNNTIKIIAGALLGGTVFGGVGAIFGVFPAVGGVGVGIGTGGLVAKLF